MATFGILGPIELRAGDRRLPAGGPRQLALLAFLLLHSNRAVSNEQLLDALWGEGATGGLKPVQMAIARLRKSLEPLERAPGAPPALRTVGGGYLLSVGAGELDADVFDAAVADGRARLAAGDAAGASRALEAALGLWRGPPLAEVALEAFAQPEIRRLQELRLGALEGRIEADLALGRHREVVGELQALTAEHPERERLCAQLMLALYRSGRETDALDAYHRVSAHLGNELGLDPGPALQALRHAISERSPDLTRSEPGRPPGGPGVARPDGAASSPAGGPGSSPAGGPGSSPAGGPGSSPAGGPGPSRPGGPGSRQPGGPGSSPPHEAGFALPPAIERGGDAFVGRTAALEQLAAAFEHASSGSRRIVMLCGEPGIGKTRLASELGRIAHGRGAVVLYGRCDEEGLLPHQPFVEALRHYICHCDAELLAGQVQLISGELRRVVPELGERVPELAQPLSGDPEGARFRLFEAVAALLCEAAQRRPLVLVLDDLHWADEATLLLLKYVARYPREARLMIVGTYRDMDVEPGHRLHGVLADLAREQASERLALGGLDADAVSELVGRHTRDRASPELHRKVFEETEGNAFFVVEILRHIAEASDDGAAPLARLPLPEGVRDLIGRRLARLGPKTTRVLGIAAVLGRGFEFDMLERLCDLGQDALVDALEQAVGAQILEESVTNVGRYAFSHSLIRDVLHATLTTTRRALLHRRAATAIEVVQGDDLEPYLAELAGHFAQAGSAPDLDKAVAYGARAGDRAIAQLAYEHAADHFRNALALLGARGSPEQRCDLEIACGEAERMAGDPAYRATLLRGAALARELGDVERLARAALANNRGSSSSSQGVDLERVAVLEAALDGLDARDSATRAGLLAQLAVELIGDADWRRRAQLGDEALAMARRIGDPRTLARVLTMRALAKWNPRTVADRKRDLYEAWRLAGSIDERLLAGYAAFLGSDAAIEAGDLARSESLLESLGALASQLGQPIVGWYESIARAKRCVVCGPPGEAERLAYAAYEIGERAGQPDALIWFLGQVFVARFLQGTLDAAEPDLPVLFEEPGSSPNVGAEFRASRSIPLMIGAAASLMFGELGRDDDARRHLDRLAEELSDLPQDYSTLPVLVWAGGACSQLGDTALASRLCDQLEPYRGQFVNTGGSWFGAVVHHLARLRATLGEHEVAERCFAVAERAYDELGAASWLARCRLDWASSLLARGEGDRAGVLLDQVLGAARELGLPVIAGRAEALRARAAA
jgi:DNA-binding SARP family transcriptional activator